MPLIVDHLCALFFRLSIKRMVVLVSTFRWWMKKCLGVDVLINYLCQGGNVFAGFCLSVCLFVCLCVKKITQKVMHGSS